MKTLALAGLTALLLCGCSAMGGPGASSERYIQLAPQPAEEWTGTGGTWQEKHEAYEFKHVSSGDLLISAMLDTMDDFPASEYRRAFDGKLAGSCSTWTSQLLDESPAAGYARQIWYTECGRDGTWTPVLHLYFTGKTAGYYAFYRWKVRPDAAAIEKWTRYMREVVVCDERPGSGAPCPAVTPVPGDLEQAAGR